MTDIDPITEVNMRGLDEQGRAEYLLASECDYFDGWQSERTWHLGRPLVHRPKCPPSVVVPRSEDHIVVVRVDTETACMGCARALGWI